MAVSGLQQRYPPVILTTSVFAPWGPGVLTPWSYEEYVDGSLDAAKESKLQQTELRRSQSWGGFSTYTHKARYLAALPLEPEPVKESALEPRPSSAPVTPVLSVAPWPGTDIRDSSKSRPSSKESLPSHILIEASSTKKTDFQTLPNRLLEAISTNPPICQTDQAQDVDQTPPAIEEDNCTTLALRNLPYSLTREELLEAINASGFSGLYDFVYLPHKFKEHRNLGFAFINFANVDAAHQFHAVWHKSRHFKVKGTVKPLNVSVAAVQGRSANELKAHSRKMGRVKNTSYLPVMFDEEGISLSMDNG